MPNFDVITDGRRADVQCPVCAASGLKKKLSLSEDETGNWNIFSIMRHINKKHNIKGKTAGEATAPCRRAVTLERSPKEEYVDCTYYTCSNNKYSIMIIYITIFSDEYLDPDTCFAGQVSKIEGFLQIDNNHLNVDFRYSFGFLDQFRDDFSYKIMDEPAAEPPEDPLGSPTCPTGNMDCHGGIND